MKLGFLGFNGLKFVPDLLHGVIALSIAVP